MEELAKATANPDEINIASDDDDDMQPEGKQWQYYYLGCQVYF